MKRRSGWLNYSIGPTSLIQTLSARSTYILESLTVKANISQNNIFCEIVSIANSSDEVNELFESKFNKKLTFSQLYDFFKSHKDYVYSSDITHVSCL